jgi:nitrite reductase/ring-hydroxylating ferredoxin subunit
MAMELCRLDDLQDGEARGFAVPEIDRKVIVVRRGDAVFAYLDACPHYADGTPMAWKRNAYLNGEGTHLACHAHGALFEIETGECVLGPCLGQALTKVTITINAAGGVQAAAKPIREETA